MHVYKYLSTAAPLTFIAYALVLATGCPFTNPNYAPTQGSSLGSSSGGSTSSGTTTVPTSGSSASTSSGSEGSTTAPTSSTSTGETLGTVTTIDETTIDVSTDPTSTSDGSSSTDDPTLPTTESESDSEGNACIPQLFPEPVIEIFDVINEAPPTDSCNTGIEYHSQVIWIEDTLYLQACEMGCGCGDEEKFTLAINPNDPDPAFKLSPAILPPGACISYRLDYGLKLDNFECGVSGLLISDDFQNFIAVTDGQIMPPLGGFTTEVVDHEQCSCECCDLVEPAPGQWSLLFSGLPFDEEVVVPEGPALDISYNGMPAVVKTIYAYQPDDCDPQHRPFSWILSTFSF